ncbi:MAG TPA: hypothetical protein ENH06_00770 [bacterium]|nr:hypothetical protein [bacterium]
MKISHEVPFQLMNVSRFFNDYDYALVHLFEKNNKYRDFFMMSESLGREWILDNSLYELKKSFDSERFLFWIRETNPTFYIIPDDYDPEINMKKFNHWLHLEKESNVKNKKIAVIHGNNYDDITFSYRKMNERLQEDDMIAFSTGSKIVTEMGRFQVIEKLYQKGLINENRGHHLLGATLPQEFKKYRDFSWIRSVDTSSPVMASIEGTRISFNGLKLKPKITVNEIFFYDLKMMNWNLLYHNISMFRRFCNER